MNEMDADPATGLEPGMLMRLRFQFSAARNWLRGFGWANIPSCRSCGSTTGYHYLNCPRGAGR